MKTNQNVFRVHSAVLRSALKKLAPIAINKIVAEAVNGNVLVGVKASENVAELVATDFTVKARVKMPIFAAAAPIAYDRQIAQPEDEVVNDGKKNYKAKPKTEAAEEVVILDPEEVEQPEPEVEAEYFDMLPEDDEDWVDDLPIIDDDDEDEYHGEEDEDAGPFGDDNLKAEVLPPPSYSQEYDYFFLLPIAPALAILDTDAMVTVDATEPELISIKDSNSKENEYKIASFNPKDYPVGLFAASLPQAFFEVSAEELKTAASVVGQFVSADHLRPALTGINLMPMHKKIKVAGSDAHAFAVKTVQTNSEFTGTVPGFTLPPIVFKLLPAGGSVGVFYLFNGEVVLQSNEITIQVTPIDARYPDYSVIIPPKDYTELSVIIGKTELLKVLKKAVHLADKAVHKVHLLIDTEKCTIRLFAPIFSDAGAYNSMDIMLPAKLEIAPRFDEQGFPVKPATHFQIAFNSQMMQKLISQFVSDESVVMEMSAPERAIVVNRTTNDTVSLMMPIMVNH